MMTKKVVVGITIGIVAVLVAALAMPLVAAAEEKEVFVHSGAGMRKVTDKIGEEFEKEEGIKVRYNYAGAGQLLTQMELTREGDIFIPGGRPTFNKAKEKGFIVDEHFVAYHIPVIGVPKGNPANITCLEDLAKQGIRVALGDPNAVPIGKAAVKILKKNGIYEDVKKNVVSWEVEEPIVVKDVMMRTVDAGIFWRASLLASLTRMKEIDIIEIPKEKNDIKIVPIGVLTFSGDKESARKYVDFHLSEKGKAIWESESYVTYPNEKYGLVEEAPTPTQTPEISPEVTPTPSPSPMPTPASTPGFEAIFAIAELLAVAYLLKRIRRG